MTISDKDRDRVKAMIEALGAVSKAVDVACKPFDDMRREIGNARAMLLEVFGVEGGDDITFCMGCRKPLFFGDMAHIDGGEDRDVTCEDCCPTYGDWQDAAIGRLRAAAPVRLSQSETIVQACERIASAAEDVQDDIEALNTIDGYLASGGRLTDKLHMAPLE